ncbi:MAG TPA: DoxX family protein [Kofleriaceae bacterium]|jgi:putative oxidoreductase|nr:DoxX family protein [Kofleriaceae bacterium]
MQASIAERFAWGRPYDPVAHDTLAPVVPRSGTALIGRILMAAIFIVSGFAKLTDPGGASGYMHMAGIGHADQLVYVAGAAELAGGLALLFGFLTRIAAIGLIVLLVIITYFFHNFWALSGADAKMQMVQFFKNLGLMGGLFMVVAMGPGRYSIDRRIRHPKAA